MRPTCLFCAWMWAMAATPVAAAALDDLAIPVAPEHPREFIFTDKGAAHLAGCAVGEDTRSYHGFYVAMHELMDGWSLRLEDGRELSAATADSAVVLPDRLLRYHGVDGAVVVETVTLLDRSDGFQVVYDGVPPGGFAFVPRIDMRFLWKVVRPDYLTVWEGGVLGVARADRVEAAAGERNPPWLAVAVAGAADFAPTGRYLPRRYPVDAARKAMEHGMKNVEVYVKGPGAGRESALRALQTAGFHVVTIKDVTPIPHNGCRPPKRRRV